MWFNVFQPLILLGRFRFACSCGRRPFLVNSHDAAHPPCLILSLGAGRDRSSYNPHFVRVER